MQAYSDAGAVAVTVSVCVALGGRVVGPGVTLSEIDAVPVGDGTTSPGSEVVV